jgi:zinc protease
MNRTLRFDWAISRFWVIALLLVNTTVFAQVRDWREIRKPPLRELKLQEPKRIQLSNGMVIFLQEDHELPLINGTAVIRGGSREEPADKAGLASIYGQVWRTGGTKTRSGDQLDDFLEARAARVETIADIDSSAVTFDTLKQNLDEVFDVFVELLRQPQFREDKLPIAKNQINTGIARRNDDPIQIANRESVRIAYGADSPYARVPQYYTVAAVNRDDLVAWHTKYVHPNNIILGVVGDFNSAAMEQKLRRAFSSWPRGPAAPKPQIEIASPKPGVYFISKEDVNQTNIRMVHLGTTRDNPDYYALEVMNEIFGGGFAARLFSNIRSKKGLAYNVGGGVGSDWDHPGLFRITMGTKSETTAAAIDALHEEVRNLIDTPSTDVELGRAKEALLNSYVFRFDSKEKILNDRMNLEFYGYPLDWTARYRGLIEKVTAADVARVARKYVHPEQVALLVVGKPADFDRPLSSFGAVQTVDITIPETKPGAAVAAQAQPTATTPEARALVGKIVRAIGDPSRLRDIRSLRSQVAITAKLPQGEMQAQIETTAVLPDRLRQKMTMPMGEMVMVATPDSAFVITPMGPRDLPASQKENLFREFKRTPLLIASQADDPSITFTTAGTQRVGNVDAVILDVRGKDVEVRYFVDPATGRVLRASGRGMGPTGPGEQAIDFTEWRTFDGLTLPSKGTVTMNGEPSGSMEIIAYEINPAVDLKLFDKPAASGS